MQDLGGAWTEDLRHKWQMHDPLCYWYFVSWPWEGLKLTTPGLSVKCNRTSYKYHDQAKVLKVVN